jgi:hypothetical protein
VQLVEYTQIHSHQHYKHYIRFDASTVVVINAVYEIIDDGALTAAGRPMKNNIWDFTDRNKKSELFENNGVLFSLHNRNIEAFL